MWFEYITDSSEGSSVNTGVDQAKYQQLDLTLFPTICFTDINQLPKVSTCD